MALSTKQVYIDITKLKKELGIYKELIDRVKSALDKRLPAKEVIQETETIKPEKR
jgi:hypothetical protein